MTLFMSGRTEDVARRTRGCPCCDPDGVRTKLVRWVPFYGAVTLTWTDTVTGQRRRCAPVTTESNS